MNEERAAGAGDAASSGPGSAAPGSVSGRAVPAAVELISCEMPGGCDNVVEYAGAGRRPKYCYLTVDGVAHTRYNAHRVNQGLLTLPAAGSRGGTGSSSAETSAARPVSLARASLEAVRDEIASTVTGHQTWMSSALARVEEVLATATDPDAAAAEVTAAHRESRALVDAAEAAAENATTRARTAQTAATAANAAQAQAEQAAEDALAERDEATEERDRYVGLLADRDTELHTTRARLDETELAHRQALAERDQLAEQLAHVHTERDRVTAELGELAEAHGALRAQHEETQSELLAARDELAETTTNLRGARGDVAEQRQRGDAAEQAVAELRTELADARTRGEERAQAAAEARTSQAVTAAENTALTRQLERDVASERRHGEQRLADLRERHAEELRALRQQGAASEAGSDPETDHAAASAATTPTATTPGRRGTSDRPTRARRRTGERQNRADNPDSKE